MDKLKNIKIAFIDIDGTLSNSQRKQSMETIKAIKNAANKGLYIVLCSGRTNQYVCNVSKEVSASNFSISCNGGEIYDYKNEKILFANKINFDDIKKIWSYCIENNVNCILNSTNLCYYTLPLSSTGEIKLIKSVDTKLINNIDYLINEDIFQIVVSNNDLDKMQKMEKFISEIKSLKITNASSIYIDKIKNGDYYFFDITNNNVSKGNAIKKVLNYLNLTKEEAIGFGDHINDHDLFNSVGFKIAMGNANGKLKEQADFITLSNDENGVAYFLNNFIDYNK